MSSAASTSLPELTGADRRGLLWLSQQEYAHVIGTVASMLEKGLEVSSILRRKHGNDSLALAEELIATRKDSLGIIVERTFPHHIERWRLSELEIVK